MISRGRTPLAIGRQPLLRRTKFNRFHTNIPFPGQQIIVKSRLCCSTNGDLKNIALIVSLMGLLVVILMGMLLVQLLMGIPFSNAAGNNAGSNNVGNNAAGTTSGSAGCNAAGAAGRVELPVWKRIRFECCWE